MHFRSIMGIAAVAAVAFAGAAQADTTAFNSTPAAGWQYGTGNDYAPANTTVLTTDAGDELYLRAHQTFLPAPASTADTYSFPTGLDFISFDWGFTALSASLDNVTALITLTNYAGGNFSYDPLFVGNDNEGAGGAVQNSARLNWYGIDPNVDGSYGVELAVNGLEGGPKSLSIRIEVGEGYQAVPEPSTWALMVLAFGGAGAALRRRRALALA